MRLIPVLLLMGCAAKYPASQAHFAEDVWIAGSPEAPKLCLSPVVEAGPVPKADREVWRLAIDKLDGGDVNGGRLLAADLEGHPALDQLRASMALVSGDVQAGKRIIEIANKYPEDGCLAYQAGMAALALQDLEDAQRWLTQASVVHPGHPEVAKVQAVLLLQRGELEQARQTLGRALEADPTDQDVRMGLASISLEMGDLAGAAEHLEVLIEAGRTELLDMLMRVRFVEGELDQYVRAAAKMGMPLGDNEALIEAPKPFEALRAEWGLQGDQKFWVDIDTNAGVLSCELFPEVAPVTVANFVGLAKGTQAWMHPDTGTVGEGGLYDGTIFHRVIPEFMIQGGDPTGTGRGNPGYRFLDELDAQYTFDRPGRLAMANSGPDTNGSQFFITEVPVPHLDGRHTIFGQCTEETLETVKKMARVEARDTRPVEDLVIRAMAFRTE